MGLKGRELGFVVGFLVDGADLKALGLRPQGCSTRRCISRWRRESTANSASPRGQKAAMEPWVVPMMAARLLTSEESLRRSMERTVAPMWKDACAATAINRAVRYGAAGAVCVTCYGVDPTIRHPIS